MGVAFTEERLQRHFDHLKASRFWWVGDWFKASDVSPHLKLPAKSVGVLLRDLYKLGFLQRETTGNRHKYRRPQKSMLSRDWRVDVDVYQLIDELERGW